MQISLMYTDNLLSSTSALLLPNEASSLPQLGSFPCTAVLTRLELEIVLAASRASSILFAFSIVT